MNKLKKTYAFFLVFTLLCWCTGPAYASSFVPSIEAKPAPEVIPIEGNGNNSIVAVIQDPQKNVVVSVPSGELIVTPLSQVNKADADIQDMLITAQQDYTTNTLLELSQEVIPYLEQHASDISSDDLIIRDVIDATVRGTYHDYLEIEGNTITIRFGVNIPQGSFLMIMVNCDIKNGGIWEVIPLERITRHADGSVSITFDNLCPILFITDGGVVDVDPNGPLSPQTGTPKRNGVFIAGLFLSAMAVTTILFKKEKAL